MIANITPGVVAVVGGIIALYNMDRIDRRKTFIIGLSLTTTCHCLIGVASMMLPVGNPQRPWIILLLVVARGLGIGVALFFGWATNGVLALYFPSLVEGIGITGAFFMFAAIGDRAALRHHPGAGDP